MSYLTLLVHDRPADTHFAVCPSVGVNRALLLASVCSVSGDQLAQIDLRLLTFDQLTVVTSRQEFC